MNPPSTTVNLPIRLTQESSDAIHREAERLSLSFAELASAILDAAAPFDSMTESENAHAHLSQIKLLYPERWPALKSVFLIHSKIVARAKDQDRATVDEILDQTFTVKLTPALVAFMRDVSSLLPGLWDRFISECVEVVINSIHNYAAANYSFKSAEDRRETFRQIERAKETYLQNTKSRETTAL